MEHVHRGTAGVDFGSSVVDHGEEFSYRRNVDHFHLLFHHRSGESGYAWQCSDQRGHVHARVTNGSDLQLVHPFLYDRVKAEEREEDRGLDTFHASTVGHDEARIDAF